jgi:uracil phosphoribosyltransferase
MELQVLDKQNTILNRFIAEMRDVRIQTDRMRFRRNLERCGEIMAYEISKTLTYTPQTVETPLGEAMVSLSDERIVIATILRAGIPYHQGFLNYFDDASSAFVSAFRKYSKDGTFKVKVEYVSSGGLDGVTMILVDPMLATGASTVLTYKALLERGGVPRHTHIASVIASEEGLAYVRDHLPDRDVTIWCGAVDEELTVKSYIIPGLGDAGDLAYGDKLQS